MSNKEPKISLEDLLSLKRQEKPSEAFWDSFSKQLQEKTLQAAIKKPSFFSRIGDFYKLHFKTLIPATGVAVLTLSFMSYSSFSHNTHKLVAHSENIISDTSMLLAAQKNLLQNSLREEARFAGQFANSQFSSQSFSEGVHYLSGSVANIGLDTTIKSNMLY